MTVNLRPVDPFVPRHTRGDREFAGHGPNVSVTTSLRVFNRNQLWAFVSMTARETRSDWTTASGSKWFKVYEDPRVVRINDIRSDAHSSLNYTDTDHRDDVFRFGSDELVRWYAITGDTGGSEAGTRTKVRQAFNPVTIDVDFDSTKCPPKTISSLTSPFFVPDHTRGDREFAGHGPRVTASARLYPDNGNEIWVDLFMQARETQSDWTTARERRSFRLYRHSRPVRRILYDTTASHSYTDDDHGTDRFLGNDPVRQWEFVGDTGGSEAGTRTGVRVRLRPIVIEEGRPCS